MTEFERANTQKSHENIQLHKYLHFHELIYYALMCTTVLTQC